MIEVWTLNGFDGTIGRGVNSTTVETLALHQAILDGTLETETLEPGAVRELTPPGDTSPQFLYAYDDGTAEVSELSRGEEAGTYKTYRAEIGPDSRSRQAICVPEGWSNTGSPQFRVFWLIDHVETAPELDDLRNRATGQPR